jgi:hypothetical protein
MYKLLNLKIESIMTLEELTQAQKKLHEEIQQFAEKHCLANDNICPIYDGVENIEAYLKSPLKIMWLLKEPYDEDGGGWNISAAYKNEAGKKKATYRRMAAATFGFTNNMYYEQIRKMSGEIDIFPSLDSIAYINLSKMPGNNRTSSASAKAYYTLWKDILHKQINVYNPDVIIFGGTMNFFEFSKEPHLFDTYFNSDVNPDCKAKIYQHENRWSISIYHPSAIVSDEVYIDLLIDSLKTIQKNRK